MSTEHERRPDDQAFFDQSYYLTYLKDVGPRRLTDLVDTFEASTTVIAKNLDDLVAQGKLRRTPGSIQLLDIYTAIA